MKRKTAWKKRDNGNDRDSKKNKKQTKGGNNGAKR